MKHLPSRQAALWRRHLPVWTPRQSWLLYWNSGRGSNKAAHRSWSTSSQSQSFIQSLDDDEVVSLVLWLKDGECVAESRSSSRKRPRSTTRRTRTLLMIDIPVWYKKIRTHQSREQDCLRFKYFFDISLLATRESWPRMCFGAPAQDPVQEWRLYEHCKTGLIRMETGCKIRAIFSFWVRRWFILLSFSL